MEGNTTPIHGKVCRVEKNGTLMEFTESWNINVSMDVADISRQGQNWKEILPGMSGWDGSFSGLAVHGNTEQAAIFDNIIVATPGTKLTDMEFNLEDTGDYFSGDLYITGVSFGPGIGDAVKFTVNFQGTGALSKTLA